MNEMGAALEARSARARTRELRRRGSLAMDSSDAPFACFWSRAPFFKMFHPRLGALPEGAGLASVEYNGRLLSILSGLPS
jgi:hypothetical protein